MQYSQSKISKEQDQPYLTAVRSYRGELLNISIGSHRLREYGTAYVLEYRQKARKEGVERWRERCYPSTLLAGLQMLAHYEVPVRSDGCVSVRDLIVVVEGLQEELVTCAQLMSSSNAA